MKNYIKEYNGHKVPKGATHWLVNGFAKWDDNKSISVIGCFQGAIWKKCSYGMLPNAIELPEAPQEWNGEGLPPVGCECEIKCFYKSGSGWKKCYIVGSTKDDNHLVVHTYYDDELNFAVKHIGDVKFRPLKTQQEKDREAFIDSVNGVFSDGEFDRHDLVLIAERLFDAEFTAPKETDNE